MSTEPNGYQYYIYKPLDKKQSCVGTYNLWITAK